MPSSAFSIESLGSCKIGSPLQPLTGKQKTFPFVEDEKRIYMDIHSKEDLNTHPSFEKAGPRRKIFFDPSKSRVGIVTCGGLCPGINNVIRTIVMQMHYHYKVKNIYGFKYGYEGFIADYGHQTIKLTPEFVKDLHNIGGSILSSSRGEQDVEQIIDCLEREAISILFCIGGDGTLKGAHAISNEIKKRGLKISIIGIPKTIDNDILYCAKTFGFETAFYTAVDSIKAAHVEAQGAPYGIGLVKLMGRDSGFIAANSALACPDVNFVLIPEIPFDLEGKSGLLSTIESSMQNKRSQGRHPHTVIVVAEGAGQYFFNNPKETDLSGNVRYGDIGLYLKDKIAVYFKDRCPVNIKYIEPSYMIRSVPANPHDAIFCHFLAENAVHAGMAGKTNMMIGYWSGTFTHVPLKEVIKGRKKIDPNGELWRQVVQTTGQPVNMENK
ncbi:ATP-dependent 6-phosphofructokinase [Deltaproteobacteria bacterium TL4]